VLIGAAAGCVAAEEAIRPGPPETLVFAPPPGLAQLERWVERRAVKLYFPDQQPVSVVDVLAGTTEEKYEPLPQGGFRVTSTVLDQGLTRNGTALPSPLPLEGVPLVHIVDAQGRFVSAVDAAGTALELQGRLRDKRMRQALEPLLTPEFVRERIAAGWRARVESICGKSQSPGDAAYGLESQELPIGPPVPMLVRRRALGFDTDGTSRVLTLGLTFAGRQAPWVGEPAVKKILDSLEDGLGTLPAEIAGQGERLMSVSTCQVVRETTQVRGTVPVDRRAAQAAGVPGLPEKLEFEVHREVVREPRAAR
jgi:hypothetical protein